MNFTFIRLINQDVCGLDLNEVAQLNIEINSIAKNGDTPIILKKQNDVFTGQSIPIGFVPTGKLKISNEKIIAEEVLILEEFRPLWDTEKILKFHKFFSRGIESIVVEIQIEGDDLNDINGKN